MNDMEQLRQSLLKIDDLLASCMRCGNCQAVCPVFSQTCREADVARGKIVLLQNLAYELIKDPKAVEERLTRCLLCGACEHNCSTGVKTLEIFVEGRIALTQYLKLSPIKKFIFQSLLTHPKLFKNAIRTGSLFQGLILRRQKNKQNTATAPLLKPFLGARHIPTLPKKQLSEKYGVLVGDKSKKYNVIFYPGCMSDKVYTQIGDAVLSLLFHYDVGVIMPDDFSCCGLPALASGDKNGFDALVKNNIGVFERIGLDHGVDYIVSACPSCTETLHKWWLQLSGNYSLKERDVSQKISAKAIDMHDFLYNVLKIDTSKTTPKENAAVITYHESCHLKKSLGISKEVRELLKLNENYVLKEMAEADKCCGCGGSFTLTQPELSLKIGTRKWKNIVDSGAEEVVTACPACMMQIADMLGRNQTDMKVRHSLEILAETLTAGK